MSKIALMQPTEINPRKWNLLKPKPSKQESGLQRHQNQDLTTTHCDTIIQIQNEKSDSFSPSLHLFTAETRLFSGTFLTKIKIWEIEKKRINPKIYKCFKWRQSSMEDNLKSFKLEFLINPWSDLALILNLCSEKTNSNERWPQSILDVISQKPQFCLTL